MKDVSLLYKLLKLVDLLKYLSSNISSTENEVKIRTGRAWTDIDKLSIILKSDLTGKKKRDFLLTLLLSEQQYDYIT